MSLPLHGRASIDGFLPDGLYKILGAQEALAGSFPIDRVIVDLRHGPLIDCSALAEFGFPAVIGNRNSPSQGTRLHSLSNDRVVGEGDVIRLRDRGKFDVLFRRGANANSLFVTEACNSRCLMCSQPPREIDDSWRVSELLDLVSLMDRDMSVLGVTGGEPTLLGSHLVTILERADQYLPDTAFHILTNGRRFADPDICSPFDRFRQRIVWAIPVYGDTAILHDRVVDATGAFGETIHGLYNLAERGHRIEIRMVISDLTLPRLVKTAEFYTQSLPFAEHIALMGLEPMGYARQNKAILQYDHEACNQTLLEAVALLDQAGLTVSVYNIPLCFLDPKLHRFARQSISDWKNDFEQACDPCQLRQACCGLFRSADTSWRRALKPKIETAA